MSKTREIVINAGGRCPALTRNQTVKLAVLGSSWAKREIKNEKPAQWASDVDSFAYITFLDEMPMEFQVECLRLIAEDNNDGYFYREDSRLIQAVKTHPESGNLKVVEIPRDVEWIVCGDSEIGL